MACLSKLSMMVVVGMVSSGGAIARPTGKYADQAGTGALQESAMMRGAMGGAGENQDMLMQRKMTGMTGGTGSIRDMLMQKMMARGEAGGDMQGSMQEPRTTSAVMGKETSPAIEDIKSTIHDALSSRMMSGDMCDANMLEDVVEMVRSMMSGMCAESASGGSGTAASDKIVSSGMLDGEGNNSGGNPDIQDSSPSTSSSSSPDIAGSSDQELYSTPGQAPPLVPNEAEDVPAAEPGEVEGEGTPDMGEVKETPDMADVEETPDMGEVEETPDTEEGTPDEQQPGYLPVY